MSVVAFLALGANLGEPLRQFEQASTRLRASGIAGLRWARLYGSKPLGPPGQPDYLNTVLEIQTDRSPLDLLDLCQDIENELGRVRQLRWGPRVIDIDLALYGEHVVDHPRLKVPHPGLLRRRFVLAPLADLAPELKVPGSGRSVRELLNALEDEPGSLWSLADSPGFSGGTDGSG